MSNFFSYKPLVKRLSALSCSLILSDSDDSSSCQSSSDEENDEKFIEPVVVPEETVVEQEQDAEVQVYNPASGAPFTPPESSNSVMCPLGFWIVQISELVACISSSASIQNITEMQFDMATDDILIQLQTNGNFLIWGGPKLWIIAKPRIPEFAKFIPIQLNVSSSIVTISTLNA